MSPFGNKKHPNITCYMIIIKTYSYLKVAFTRIMTQAIQSPLRSTSLFLFINFENQNSYTLMTLMFAKKNDTLSCVFGLMNKENQLREIQRGKQDEILPMDERI